MNFHTCIVIFYEHILYARSSPDVHGRNKQSTGGSPMECKHNYLFIYLFIYYYFVLYWHESHMKICYPLIKIVTRTYLPTTVISQLQCFVRGCVGWSWCWLRMRMENGHWTIVWAWFCSWRVLVGGSLNVLELFCCVCAPLPPLAFQHFIYHIISWT